MITEMADPTGGQMDFGKNRSNNTTFYAAANIFNGGRSSIARYNSILNVFDELWFSEAFSNTLLSITIGVGVARALGMVTSYHGELSYFDCDPNLPVESFVLTPVVTAFTARCGGEYPINEDDSDYYILGVDTGVIRMYKMFDNLGTPDFTDTGHSLPVDYTDDSLNSTMYFDGNGWFFSAQNITTTEIDIWYFNPVDGFVLFSTNIGGRLLSVEFNGYDVETSTDFIAYSTEAGIVVAITADNLTGIIIFGDPLRFVQTISIVDGKLYCVYFDEPEEGEKYCKFAELTLSGEIINEAILQKVDPAGVNLISKMFPIPS